MQQPRITAIQRRRKNILSDITDIEVLCTPSSLLHTQKIPEPPPIFTSQCFIHCNTYSISAIEHWLTDNLIGEYYIANKASMWGWYIGDIYFEFREDAVLFLVSHK